MNRFFIPAIISAFIASCFFASCSNEDLGLDENDYYGNPAVTCGYSVYEIRNMVGEIAYEKKNDTYFFYLERGRYNGIDSIAYLLDKKIRFSQYTDTIRQIINQTGKKVILDADITFVGGVTHPIASNFDIRKYDKKEWLDSEDNKISYTNKYRW